MLHEHEHEHASAASSLFGPDVAHVQWLEPDDEVDLAGLVNALDGVVDSPGRIVVMTTNHPDKLDPALIRPARVNIKLHLGHMQTPQALQMVAHYFEKHTFADEERQAFVRLFPSRPISPARLEEMCAEHDTVPQLLHTLGMLAKGKSLSEFGVC
jgi:chaperone BCS1